MSLDGVRVKVEKNLEANSEETPRASLYAECEVKVEGFIPHDVEEVEVETEDTVYSSQTTMEPRCRASYGQFTRLIEFMESHGDLAHPRTGLQGRVRAEGLWKHLASQLNSVSGGVVKPRDRWKKVWADWKTKTKKKALSVLHRAGAEGHPVGRQGLSALEERVLAIMGLSTKSALAKVQIPPQLPRPMTPPQQEPSEPETPNVPSGSEPLGMDTPPSPLPSPPGRQQRAARRPGRRTAFGRAASGFLALERRRLALEEVRERNQHERETEALRIEAERVQVEWERVKVNRERVQIYREFNAQLRLARELAQSWLDRYTPRDDVRNERTQESTPRCD